MTWDVIVIGGGPAGSATAMAARLAGLEVLVLEKSRPPFRKVCGEFLSEPGMELFRRLHGDTGAFPLIRTVAFGNAVEAESGDWPGLHEPVVLRLKPGGYGVTRETLDTALLASAARCGVAVRTGVRVSSVRRGRQWTVETIGSSPLEHETVMGRRVVMATGRVPGERSGNVWIGGKRESEVAPEAADLEIGFLPGGYYGRSRVNGGVSLCGLMRAIRAKDRDDEAVAEAKSRRGTPCFRLGYQPPVTPGTFPVGDALAAWPPLAGDGITMALHSGHELGTRLADPDFEPAEWLRYWRSRFAGGLARSLFLHSVVERAALRRSILYVAQFSSGFGSWLIGQPRFRRS